MVVYCCGDSRVGIDSDWKTKVVVPSHFLGFSWQVPNDIKIGWTKLHRIDETTFLRCSVTGWPNCRLYNKYRSIFVKTWTVDIYDEGMFWKIFYVVPADVELVSCSIRWSSFRCMTRSGPVLNILNARPRANLMKCRRRYVPQRTGFLLFADEVRGCLLEITWWQKICILRILQFGTLDLKLKRYGIRFYIQVQAK